MQEKLLILLIDEIFNPQILYSIDFTQQKKHTLKDVPIPLY